ncbi:scyllo-inositol 2-dehydrogenase (NADP(+)) IolW [Emticicia aquatica]|uniref:Scyllo-inositol 2-dehydrogenase (NADP(+)) IolW n=1 Tax=Emticicia aquatica TaxID=1681835 RepID=A0ABM9AUC6_9BACT|nr:Gfo/Idh/MocA family oxidoreductase [Emticicia aquatica]CAH0997641.1 scyllo-inositol 2-dehydrogenase (NADP(+)) IolW [Emticicia aquatica]
MLNVAIIGFGLSGRYLQAPFFLANPNFNLKTIVSASQNPQEIYPSVQVARSIDEILANDEIDLVSIASPNGTHYDFARRCLLAGKHVLVEKPFTSTVAEAEEVIQLAKTQGKVLSVFQNRRFDSDFMTVKKVVENKLLGDLLSFEIHFDRHKPILNPKKWKEETGPGSGIIYDLGSHIIDQTLVLFGSPKAVAGETFIQREGSTIDDAFNIRLDYGKLKVVLKSSLLVREEGPRYILHGTKGSFVKYGLDVQEDHLKAGLMPRMTGFGIESVEKWGILNTEINGQHFRGHLETEVGNWDLLFQNLFEAITEGKELLVKPEQIVEQIKIIEEVKK